MPLTKKIKDGLEDPTRRKGLCGATPETIAARNFARMVAAGAAAHSDHGRGVAETFLAAARKETHDYTIKDEQKLLESRAGLFDVAITVEGRRDEELPPGHFRHRRGSRGKGSWVTGASSRVRVYYASSAHRKRLTRSWKKLGVVPRGIDREIVEIMHRTHMGVDQDYRNITGQADVPGLLWVTAGAVP